ncbi:MAG: hypothetical protein KDH96_11270, partial [Candidatus Riesia sp.]|nr:hypothetical protein [Candidatus Riesia sp.]
DYTEQFVFDICKLKSLNCDFTPLQIILEDPRTEKIGHNIVFDYKFIKHHLGIELVNVFDTMLAEMILTKGFKLQGFGLQDVLDKYNIQSDMNKAIRIEFINHQPNAEFTTEEIEYAAKDIKFLIKLKKILIKHGEESNLLPIIKLENETVPCTGDLELNGIYLDFTEWEKLEKVALEKREKLKEKLFSYLPSNFDTTVLLPEKKREKILKKRAKQLTLDFDIQDIIDINFSSPIQVKGFLKVITGKDPSDTNEKTLKLVYRQPDGSLPDVIKDLLAYREADKQYSTYGSEFYYANVNAVTKRIHSEFKQLGADSGRYSSNNPNLQNIPALKEYRACFRAQEGYTLVCADLRQFELRVLAELALEKSWIDVMKNPKGDLHRYVAAVLYNLTEEQVTPELRTIGKTLNFSVSYGAGPTKVMETCNNAFIDANINKQMTFDEAKDALNKYRVSFPAINKLLEDSVKFVKKHHYAWSPLDGRKRYINIDWTSPKEVAHAANIAKNMCAQPINASVMKKILVLLKKYIKDNKI